MKAHLREDGTLIVYPESVAEGYALAWWSESYFPRTTTSPADPGHHMAVRAAKLMTDSHHPSMIAREVEGKA